jgi:hypothetical protein
MAGIPTRFDAEMTKWHSLHSSLSCKVSIIRNAGLRTTPGGDVRVKAEAQIARTRDEIEELLRDYADQVRALLAVEHA